MRGDRSARARASHRRAPRRRRAHDPPATSTPPAPAPASRSSSSKRRSPSWSAYICRCRRAPPSASGSVMHGREWAGFRAPCRRAATSWSRMSTPERRRPAPPHERRVLPRALRPARSRRRAARQRRDRPGPRVRPQAGRDDRRSAARDRHPRRHAGAQGTSVRKPRDRGIRLSLPTEWLPRMLAAGPHPAKIAQGAEAEGLPAGGADRHGRRCRRVASPRRLTLPPLTSTGSIETCPGRAAVCHGSDAPTRARRPDERSTGRQTDGTLRKESNEFHPGIRPGDAPRKGRSRRVRDAPCRDRVAAQPCPHCSSACGC